MAEVGGELRVTGAFPRALEGEHDVAVLLGREKPVAGEADHEGVGPHRSERVFQGAAVGAGEVEAVDRAGDVEIGVGVEPVDEALPLVAQVALDLELDVEGGGGGRSRLRTGAPGTGGGADLAAAEFAVHGRVGEVGDVGHHAGDGEAHARAAAGRVVALVPARVLEDGLAADLVEGDGLRALAGGGGHGEDLVAEIRILDGPLERLHAPHGAAEGAEQAFDAEVVEQALLRAHHVADGDGGERDPVGAAGGGIGGEGAGGALAAAEHVGADDEVVVGVHGLAGADEVVPPAGLAVVERVDAGAVVVAGEGVADEDGVVGGGVEAAVGLVAQGETREHVAVVAGEGLGAGEIARLDEADLAGFGGGGGGKVVVVEGGVVHAGGWERDSRKKARAAQSRSAGRGRTTRRKGNGLRARSPSRARAGAGPAEGKFEFASGARRSARCHLTFDDSESL